MSMNDLHGAKICTESLQHNLSLFTYPVVLFSEVHVQAMSVLLHEHNIQFSDGVHLVVCHAQTCIDT